MSTRFQPQHYTQNTFERVVTRDALGALGVMLVPKTLDLVRWVAVEVPDLVAAFGGRNNPESTGRLDPIEQDLPQQQAAQVMYVTANPSLNVRAQPGGAIVGSIPRGTAVTVVGTNADKTWAQIQYNGQLAWVSMKYLATSAPAAAAPVSGGGGSAAPAGFIGTNVTDLPYLAGNPDAVREQLRILRDQGITDIRVWPFWAGADPDTAAARLKVVADIAREMGMKLTVDLFDAHGTATFDQLTNAAKGWRLDEMIQKVVGLCKGYNDVITWSVGNEIQAPDNPTAFADWYVAQIRAIKRIDPGARISVEIVPGAVGYLDGSNDQAKMDARRRIIAASDVVSLHLYPYRSPEYAENLLKGPPIFDPSNADFEMYWTLRSLKEWQAAAGRKFRVGEFGVDGDPAQGVDSGPYRTDEALLAWLRYFRDQLGVREVLLWHYGATYAGENAHLDGLGYPGGQVTPALRNGGFIR